MKLTCWTSRSWKVMLTVSLSLTGLARAASYEIRSDKAAMVSRYEPTINYGSDETLPISLHAEYDKYGLTEWDLSAVPVGVVSNARIVFTIVDTNKYYTMALYSADAAWDEDTVTWANQPNSPVETYDWQWLGFVGQTEYGAPTNWVYIFEGQDVDRLVQSWINGVTPNNGVYLRKSFNSATKQYAVYSDDTTNETNRPTLTFDLSTDRVGYKFRADQMTYVWQASAYEGDNFGDETTSLVRGNWTQSETIYSLIGWSLPASFREGQVGDIRVTLYYHSGYSWDLELFEVNGAWDEHTVVWTNQPNDHTRPKTDTAEWHTLATASVDAATSYWAFAESAALEAYVSGWVTGDGVNNGLYVLREGAETINNYVATIYSDETGWPWQRPLLEFTITPPRGTVVHIR